MFEQLRIALGCLQTAALCTTDVKTRQRIAVLQIELRNLMVDELLRMNAGMGVASEPESPARNNANNGSWDRTGSCAQPHEDIEKTGAATGATSAPDPTPPESTQPADTTEPSGAAATASDGATDPEPARPRRRRASGECNAENLIATVRFG